MTKIHAKTTKWAMALLASTFITGAAQAGKFADMMGDFVVDGTQSALHKAAYDEAAGERGDVAHGVAAPADGESRAAYYRSKMIALITNEEATADTLKARAAAERSKSMIVSAGSAHAVQAVLDAFATDLEGITIVGKKNTAALNSVKTQETAELSAALHGAAGRMKSAFEAVRNAYGQLAGLDMTTPAEQLHGLLLAKSIHDTLGAGAFGAFKADPTKWAADHKDDDAFKDMITAADAALKDEDFQDALEADTGNFAYTVGGLNWQLVKAVEQGMNAMTSKHAALAAWEEAKASVDDRKEAVEAKKADLEPKEEDAGE